MRLNILKTAFAFFPLLLCSDLTAQQTLILAGTLVDPASGESLRNQKILVEGSRIISIGEDLTVDTDPTIIDLSSSVVLPGLMDAHTHLSADIDPHWDLGDTWIMALQRREGYRAIQSTRHAREMLEAGFTTVRDLGNAGDYLDMDLEKAIRFGAVPGPTIIPAGRIIAPFGGQFWDTPADGELLHNPEYYFADSHDELRKAIRENIYWGAKVIKIVVDGQRYIYSKEDIRFIVEEARRAGVKVAAHVQTAAGARAALEAGVASIEHGWEMEAEHFALAVKNDVALVGTDFTVRSLLAQGMTEEEARASHARRVDRLQRAWQAGVNIVFGTDGMRTIRGETRGTMAIEFVDSFVEAGIPPEYILRAMTLEAARLLGVDHERGLLEPGMAADIIAVTENPLADIAALKAVHFVMRNGRIYRHDAAN